MEEDYGSILRALLMANGGSCPISLIKEELKNEGSDFGEILNNNRNFVNFLKKMSDVCYLSLSPENMIMVNVKSIEDTTHMNNFIKAQNARKKARKPIRTNTTSSAPKPDFYFRTVNNSLANHNLQQRLSSAVKKPPSSKLSVQTPSKYHSKTPVTPKIEKCVVTKEVKDEVLAKFKPIFEDILIKSGGKCAYSTLDSELYRRLKIPLDNVAKMYGSENTFDLIKEFKTIRLIEGQNEPFVQVHPSLMPKINQSEVTVEADSQEKVPPSQHDIISAKRNQIFHRSINEINLKQERPVKKDQKKIPYPSITRLRSKMFNVSIKEMHSQFQLRLEDEFLKLCRDMREHYELNKCKPLSSVEIGDCVAVLNKQNWFRGEVILKSEQGIHVELVDSYVGIKILQLKDLYQLNEDFVTIGRKSMECTLHGVSQRENLLPSKGIVEFKKLVEHDDSHLVAKFKGVTQNKEVYEIDLIVEDAIYGTKIEAVQLLTNGFARLKL